MPKGRLKLNKACEKAAEIVSQAKDIERLYERAVRSLGEGELRVAILSMAAEALQDGSLKEEVFQNDETLVSFLCGIWIQYLLVEFAGLKREHLNALAKKVWKDIQEKKSLH